MTLCLDCREYGDTAGICNCGPRPIFIPSSNRGTLPSVLIEDFPYRNPPLAEWHLVDDNGIVLIRLPQGGGIIFSNSFIVALRKRLDETEKETTE